MAEDKHWYLLSYDIREPHRWRKVYKILKGQGDHLQYSVFRLNLSKSQLEEFRWRIEKELTEDDDLLIVRLCHSCSQRVIDSRQEINRWREKPPKFEVY